jgi:hypothetical protein
VRAKELQQVVHEIEAERHVGLGSSLAPCSSPKQPRGEAQPNCRYGTASMRALLIRARPSL